MITDFWLNINIPSLLSLVKKKKMRTLFSTRNLSQQFDRGDYSGVLWNLADAQRKPSGRHTRDPSILARVHRVSDELAYVQPAAFDGVFFMRAISLFNMAVA